MARVTITIKDVGVDEIEVKAKGFEDNSNASKTALAILNMIKDIDLFLKYIKTKDRGEGQQ